MQNARVRDICVVKRSKWIKVLESSRIAKREPWGGGGLYGKPSSSGSTTKKKGIDSENFF